MALVTKVLVVDDSLTMRALISGALERIPGVVVVGAADGAEEARAMSASLKPDVVTLDVEMPGMNGIEYLAEIMTTKPLPVIMFSTRTTAGAVDSIEALRLGAIDCFPKPRVAAAAELDAIISKLGKRIKAARGMTLKAPAAPQAAAAAPPIDWNGRLLTFGGDASSTAAMFEMFGALPANCPPILVVQHLDAGLIAGMADALGKKVAPKVVVAEDGMAIEQGTIYFAPSGDRHMIVDAWPSGSIRLLARDPVAGERPSISLLFASAAKAAGSNVAGVLLVNDTDDGAGGVRAMLAGGGFAVATTADGGITISRGAVSQTGARSAVMPTLLKLCSK